MICMSFGCSTIERIVLKNHVIFLDIDIFKKHMFSLTMISREIQTVGLFEILFIKIICFW